MAGRDGLEEFKTGATKSPSTERWAPARFTSAIVLNRYYEFMHKNRFQKDGTVREPDNWKLGIPSKNYFASLDRHFHEAKLMWEFPETTHYNDASQKLEWEDTLCAILFNVMGLLFNVLTGKLAYQETVKQVKDEH